MKISAIAIIEYQQVDGAFRADNAVISSEPIQRTEPECSEEGRLAELKGIVLLRGVIAKVGSACDLQVTRPLGLGLEEKAIEAVREWRSVLALTRHRRP